MTKQLSLFGVRYEEPEKDGINVLSLFNGCSMAYQALKEEGIKVKNYYSSEIDPYAIKVSKKNFPDIIELGDICEWENWDLPEIDLIIAGSPCQGFSFAGKQLNFDDPRSKLFFKFVDILNHFKPKYYFFENVKMSKKSQDVISEKLNSQPINVNSDFYSAQLRNRIYWTNINGFDLLEINDEKLSDIIDSGYVDRDKSFCIDANYFKGGNLKSYFEKSRRQLVFNSKEDYEKCLLDSEHKGYRKLTVEECEKLQCLPVGYTEGVSNTQRYKMIGNGFTVSVIKKFLKELR